MDLMESAVIQILQQVPLEAERWPLIDFSLSPASRSVC